MFYPEPLDDDDIARLASLHRQSLPDSALSWLGERYLRDFYRYVRRSDMEAVVVRRDPSGKITAAAVIAWKPERFLERLLRHTSAPLYLLLRAPWVAIGLLRRSLTLSKAGPPTIARLAQSAILQAPELVDLYTAPGERGQGIGAALIGTCEAFLRARDEHLFWAKTVDATDNRAWNFYRENGFQPIGTIIESETRFIVFAKSLLGEELGDLASREGRRAAATWLDKGEIFRFLIAGTANMLFSLAVYEIMLFVVPYAIAYAVAWLCGFVFGLIVYPNQVYRTPQASLRDRLIAGLLIIVVYAIGLSLLHLLQAAGLSPRIGILIVLPITATLSYASLRLLLKRDRD